jgi:imidazolonepropionase-like amidohydrolase
MVKKKEIDVVNQTVENFDLRSFFKKDVVVKEKKIVEIGNNDAIPPEQI